MKRPLIGVVALLGVALCIDLFAPRTAMHRRLAEERLGEVVPIDMPGLPAFQAGERAMLFFDHDGVEGPIRGAVVIAGDRITDVLIRESREGLDHRALSKGWLKLFRGAAARPPVVVDAISGATVSSRAVVDAVNERLKQWRTAQGLDE